MRTPVGTSSTSSHFFHHRDTEHTEADILCALCVSVVNPNSGKVELAPPITL